MRLVSFATHAFGALSISGCFAGRAGIFAFAMEHNTPAAAERRSLNARLRGPSLNDL